MFTHFFNGEFFSGDYFGSTVEVVQPTNNFAGGFVQHLWIAHINGKRYVGTYEEIEAIAEGVVEKTLKKPRIVIKPLRTVEQVRAREPETTVQEAKQVQKQLNLDVGMMLAAIIARRNADDEDDLETILTLI